MKTELHSGDLLKLAANMTREQVDKMAHALGWPDTLNVHRPRRRVKWANPYRNYYCGREEDLAWRDAMAAGLAEMEPGERSRTPGYVYWRVTDLGKRVVRLRLAAAREAVRAAKEAA